MTTLSSSRWHRTGLLILAGILLGSSAPSPAAAQNVAEELDWPREIGSDAGSILIYSPQVDSFSTDILAARAAVSLTRESGAQPVFGAVWFTSRVVTDRDADSVTYTDIHVLRVRVPGLKGDDETAFVAAIRDPGATCRLLPPR